MRSCADSGDGDDDELGCSLPRPEPGRLVGHQGTDLGLGPAK
jgi:hypothetical protein